MRPKLNDNTKTSATQIYHYVQFRNRNKETEWKDFMI